MASKVRNAENTIVNRENIQKLPNKPVQPTKPLIAKRAALGELGNKIHLKQNSSTTVGIKNDPKKITQINVEKKLIQQKKEPLDIIKDTACVKKDPVIKPDRSRFKSQLLTKETKLPVKHQELAHFKKEVLHDAISKKETEVSYSSKQLENFVDVDANDKDDPLLLGEYVKDIFEYLRELETKCIIKEDFLDLHPITPGMRSILVDWIVEVAACFGYLSETLHLSIAIVDRYLQVNKNISRETFQLVGTSAMLIAGKYEEMYLPKMSDFTYVGDYTYTEQQILEMEKDILKKLNFDFSRPLSIHFLRRYNKIASATSQEHALGKYFLELCLLRYNLCHYKPSLQAAAAFCLVKAVLNNCIDPSNIWTDLMKYYCGCDFLDFKDIIPKLASVIVKMETSKFKAIHEKYSSSKFGKVSLNSKLKGTLIKQISEGLAVERKRTSASAKV